MTFFIIILVVVATCALAAVFCVFMLFRVQWVFRAQMAYHSEAFDRPTEQWYALGCPSDEDLCDNFDQMMWSFWVWDREKFRKRRLPAPSSRAIEAGKEMGDAG